MTVPSSFSAVDPAGVQSERIARLFWSYTYIAVAVFVLVTIALMVAISRTSIPLADGERNVLSNASIERRHRAITGATAVTGLTLILLLFLSVYTSRAIASLNMNNSITVEVTGHKWWWEFKYPASVAGMQFTTAYEMHIPVGRPVEVKLEAAEVIHSFWVPSLHGKRDAIPSKHSSLLLRADRPGRYEGQCAEFCGTQHANMRFVVVVESEEEFKAWLVHSLAPAKTPDDPVAIKGQEVFLSSRCVACHAIAGIDAFATVGPNLTHIASRGELAMGTIPNNPGHLAGWIVDPQSIKPGAIMPGTPLEPNDLNALVHYLGTLR